jgi:hypothetical protein
MRTRSRPSSRKARRRGGVALVESLIAITMITIMFGGVVWFQRMFAAKTHALRAARLQAWTATIPGCEGDMVQGGASFQARAPALFTGGAMPAQSTVSASAAMTCNVEASEFNGIRDIGSLWSSIQKSVF